MKIGTRSISMLLLALVLVGTARAQHSCVVPSRPAGETTEHEHHADPGEPTGDTQEDRDCDMYVPCGVSVTVNGSAIAVDFATHIAPIAEPEPFYFSPSLPHETPPPRA